ncbi:MAG: hypothetical protein LIP28_05080, partial [Deltaproteobacteria bacterium]|nr:hypothetical protein [Deltaproteobacteria bacterium]
MLAAVHIGTAYLFPRERILRRAAGSASVALIPKLCEKAGLHLEEAGFTAPGQLQMPEYYPFDPLQNKP